MSKKKTEVTKTSDKVLSAIGIVLCVILAFVLIINCILLVQGWTQEDTQVPHILGYFPMIVYSDSMNPVFKEDDLIICKRIDPATIEVGDVITFFDPGSQSGTALLTHKVVGFATDEKTGELKLDENGNKMFITRGENKLTNTADDKDPVPYSAVVGEYTGIKIPGGGGVAMFLQTTPGMIVSVIVPIVLLIGYEVIRRKLSDKKIDEEKQDLMKELEELRRLKAEQEAAAAAAPAAGTQDVPAATDSEKPE